MTLTKCQFPKNLPLHVYFIDRFLLAVESRDLSQADKSVITLFLNFTTLQFLNNKIYSYTKNNYLALGNLVF